MPAPAPTLDVVGFGNALVDVLSTEDDAFLGRHGLIEGTMALIDDERAETLYAAMGSAVEASGGGAANTMAGLASLGSRGAFVGRVRDDQLGAVFAHDITAIGVDFPLPPAVGGAPTGRCLIVVTSGGQRTMNTFLGAAAELGPDDVDDDLVSSAAVTYLEGFLFDHPDARLAFDRAAAAAHAAGRRVALSLSDRFCVERSQAGFVALVAEGVDVLFGNEEELGSLYATDDVEAALAEAATHCEVVALTRGATGCTVVARGERHDVPAVPVDTVVDTTGAGDQFAAGFLHGLTSGRDPELCARLGALAAAEVIAHYGARPAVDLADLAAPLLA